MPALLSLDGGGVRGIIEAVALQELEKTLGVPNLMNTFDIFSGSSTGALVACGLAIGWPAEKILNIYLTKTPKVFPPSVFAKLKHRFTELLAGSGLSVPKYSSSEFETLLKETFGDMEFGELPKKTIVTSYDIKLRTPVIFKSWQEKYKKLKVRDVAQASASAPTYLPPTKLLLDGNDSFLVDGGIVANNPSICAIAEACRLGYDMASIVLVSLGTGSSLQALNGNGTRDWGIIQWAPHIIESLMDGASDVSTYQAIQILGESNVFRFQLSIPSDHAKLDDANQSNLCFLERTSRKYFRKPEVRVKLRELKTKLNGV